MMSGLFPSRPVLQEEGDTSAQVPAHFTVCRLLRALSWPQTSKVSPQGRGAALLPLYRHLPWGIWLHACRCVAVIWAAKVLMCHRDWGPAGRLSAAAATGSSNSWKGVPFCST